MSQSLLLKLSAVAFEANASQSGGQLQKRTHPELLFTGLIWAYRVIQGSYRVLRGYIRIMEKEMETTIMGLLPRGSFLLTKLNHRHNLCYFQHLKQSHRAT